MNTRGNAVRHLLIALAILVMAALGTWEGWKIFHVPPPGAPAAQVPATPAVPVIPKPTITVPPAPIPLKKVTPVKKPAASKPAKPLKPQAPPPPVAVPIPAVQAPPPPQPTEWSGNDTAVKHSGQVVIRNEHQWIQFWAEHHPDEASPDIDFASQMVVGVFAGPRPAEAFAIRIMNVRSAPNRTIVDYQEKLPPPGTFAVNVTVYPYDIKVIPKVAGSIKFNKLDVIDPSRITK